MWMKTHLDRLDAWFNAVGKKLEGKTMVIHSDLVGALAFIAFSLCMLGLMPSQIAVTETGDINAQTFPKLLLEIILVLSLAILCKEVVKLLLKKPCATVEIALLTEVHAATILCLFVLYLVLLKPLGFIFSSIVFSLLMTAYFRVRNLSYYLIGTAAAVLIGALFQFVLHVRLP
jgi:hypothetical protein